MKLSNLVLGYIKYYFTIPDLFEKFNTRKLEVRRKTLRRSYRSTIETKQVCCRVFIYFLYLVVLDIIRNNVTFIFPGKKEAYFGIYVSRGKELEEQLKIRIPEMYDYFGSGMELPKIVYWYKNTAGQIRSRWLVLNKALTQEFFNNINNGKVYG